MTIQEALQSNKPIRRKDHVMRLGAAFYYIVDDCLVGTITHAPTDKKEYITEKHNISKEDVLADDWEIYDPLEGKK